MKPITLHPVSVLVGLALAGLAVVLTGAAQAPLPTRTVLVGEVPAEWWTYVEINSSGQNYTVPPGRHFVVTTCLCNINSVMGYVLADGQDVSASLTGVVGCAGIAQMGNGTRVPFAPGTVLSMTPGLPAGYSAYFWGYLEPVR